MAERVAMSRAVHQFMDDEPLIFPDPLALSIIGAAAQAWMRQHIDMFRTEGLRRARSMVVIRSRYAEEALIAAVQQGVGQYVILGAGLDTFAYRRRDLAERLRVFEVDQPGTLWWKRARLAEAAIEMPPNVRFVAVDFNSGELAGALASAGFDRDAPVFFSWLGVVYYLARPVVLETLRYVAGQRASSRVVFDFALAESALSAKGRRLFKRFNAYNMTAGEPWLTWFMSDELLTELETLGFADLDYLSAERAEHKYLEMRTDELLIGPLIGLISAGTLPQWYGESAL